MEKQKQQEEHIKVRKELRRRINKMIRLTLSDFKVEALELFDCNSRTIFTSSLSRKRICKYHRVLLRRNIIITGDVKKA